MKKTVAVIFGGQSSEHEISRTSAQSIVQNIDYEKYNVVKIGITKNGKWLNYEGPNEKISDGSWLELAEKNISHIDIDKKGITARDLFRMCGAESDDRKIDVVFPVLHGLNGEDGTIQGLFELSGMPYVGCGVLASCVCMDKAYAKIVFEKNNIPQGKYITINRYQINKDLSSIIAKAENELSYPCFIKPSNAGSSVGISKAKNQRELIQGIKNAMNFDRRILIEEYIDGQEIECAVLGNDDPKASVLGEIIPCNEFYDYSAKYIDNASKTIIPANLPEDITNKVKIYALEAFKALDCSGLSRVDFFVERKTRKILINEINTLPGFTSISMYPKLWEAAGIPYTKLLDQLIELAFERFESGKREINI